MTGVWRKMHNFGTTEPMPQWSAWKAGNGCQIRVTGFELVTGKCLGEFSVDNVGTVARGHDGPNRGSCLIHFLGDSKDVFLWKEELRINAGMRQMSLAMNKSI